MILPYPFRFVGLAALLVFTTLRPLPSAGQPTTPGIAPAFSADSLPIQSVLAAVQQFQDSPLARYGTVGLSVRRVKDGQEIIGYNARQSLQTASTMKLVSTATALAVLGPSFRYSTFLEYDGGIQDNVLTGNLYVRGTGDPALGSGRYGGYADWPTLTRQWATAVQTAGVRRVNGSVVGDASLYDDLTTPDTWPWSDLGNYYGASLSALNINENLYRVLFRPGKAIGAPAPVLRTEPPLPYLTLNNRVTTEASGTGDRTNLYAAPFTGSVFMAGTVPAGAPEFVVKGALPDPAYSVAFGLSQQLTLDSVRVNGPPQSYRIGLLPPATQPKRTLLSQINSPPLPELMQQTNFESLNLYAEALLRTTGRALAKKPVTTAESIDAVAAFWRGKGVNLDGFRMRDGSGLSATGALTPANLTGILGAMVREPAFSHFYESIPIVGQSGTVRSLGRGTPAAGNVRAKSGTIEGVKAYAGYVTARNGELLAFAVIVNRYTPGQGATAAATAQLVRIMALLPGL
jgi:serine-type D-Ala-D-Ala carboxypeptidase/endopeptidase (penicillin-binding protein 4)